MNNESIYDCPVIDWAMQNKKKQPEKMDHGKQEQYHILVVLLKSSQIVGPQYQTKQYFAEHYWAYKKV